MKVLWITNIPFGKMLDLAGIAGNNDSGTWLDAALNDFKGDPCYNITVVTTANVKTIKMLTVDNINYCILPGGSPSVYNYKSSSNRKNWEILKEKINPDIIQIWGTEFTHGFLALLVFESCPSVIYIQGLLESISRYYLAGFSKQELKSNITLRDIIKNDWITRSQRNFLVRSRIEAKMISISKNIITENLWCSSHCKSIDPDCKIHFNNLNIRTDFFQYNWSIETMKPFTIMCNAGGYPIKGLHILLKALNLVIKKYPNAKLLIPGEESPFKKNFWERIKINGYTKFIKKLIILYNLTTKVFFLGKLNSSQMALQMQNTNIFVLPSSIENHSSTLIEAMVVGTPCIASNVGGIPEYLIHNQNGFLYRFEEFELLAEYICILFSDIEVAQKFSKNAKDLMRNSRNSNDLKINMINIYQNICNQKI